MYVAKTKVADLCLFGVKDMFSYDAAHGLSRRHANSANAYHVLILVYL